ncbi:MAG: ExbD/TolR family protein [Planctomycetota bacterium]
MVKPKTKKTEGDMTPMIDCVFLLLIFFVVSCKFKTSEGHLDVFLPKDEGQSASRPVTAEELKDMRIFALQRNGNKDIQLKLDTYLVGTYPMEMRDWGVKGSGKYDPKRLETMMETISNDFKTKLIPKLKSVAGSSKTKIVIDIDPDVPYIFAVESMNACMAIKSENVKFSAQKTRLSKINDGRVVP